MATPSDDATGEEETEPGSTGQAGGDKGKKDGQEEGEVVKGSVKRKRGRPRKIRGNEEPTKG